MKKVICILIFTIAGCNQDESGIRLVETGTSFTISEGESVEVTDSKSEIPISLIIQLVEATDSRCPATPENNISCVWAGNAIITIDITFNGEVKSLNACIGDCGFTGFVSNPEIVFGNWRFSILFEDLLPPPSETVGTNSRLKKSARLKVDINR